MTQEELAEASDLSVTLIQRLEAGRYPHVTDALLDRVACGLRLDAQQARHLKLYLQRTIRSEAGLALEASEIAKQTVDLFSPSPAVVTNQIFDVIYWNATAEAMLLPFRALDRRERNVLWSMFRCPEMRLRWTTWEENARSIIAGVKVARLQYGNLRNEFDSMIDALCATDPLFRKWWPEVEPAMAPPFTKSYVHPEYGELSVNQNVHQLMSEPEQTIIYFHARDRRTAVAFDRMLRVAQERHGQGAVRD